MIRENEHFLFLLFLNQELISSHILANVLNWRTKKMLNYQLERTEEYNYVLHIRIFEYQLVFS